MEADARSNFLKKADASSAQQDAAEAAMLARTPWAQTLERDREVCVLFPGQGTQKKGMNDKLMLRPEAKALFDRASGILGYDLAALIRDGPQVCDLPTSHMISPHLSPHLTPHLTRYLTSATAGQARRDPILPAGDLRHVARLRRGGQEEQV